jgi:L-amino acid N-acyltransferase YncA
MRDIAPVIAQGYKASMPAIEMIEVTESNVEKVGFFCAISKPELKGYQDKIAWLKLRFREGLKIKLIARGGRGFIEYMPGEFAWRAIDAQRYMVIHCLWVVGKSKGQGCGAALLDACVQDARSQKMRGVAAVTARGRLGLVDTSFFVHQGFRVVDTAPPGLDLVALKFAQGSYPKFLGGWNEKLQALEGGLTVFSSPQCPYTCEGAEQIVALARSMNIPARSVRLEHLQELRRRAPSAYGSFDMACGGEVVANLYHHMTAQRLSKLLAAAAPSLQTRWGLLASNSSMRTRSVG